MKQLTLDALTLADDQVYGALRLVPLLADRVHDDARIAVQPRGADTVGLVTLGGPLTDPSALYAAIVPHALILRHATNEHPVTVADTSLVRRIDGKRLRVGEVDVSWSQRMVKKITDDTVRMFPLHVAMEAFLASHFGGPDIVYEFWSRTALEHGFGARGELSLAAGAVPDLTEALRVFEVHEMQVGLALFTGDRLASVLVAPHPDDYRALHATLVSDFYGPTLANYALAYPDPPTFGVRLGAIGLDSLDDLAHALERARSANRELTASMLGGLFGRALVSKHVRRLGPLTMWTFSTTAPGSGCDDEHHIGEAIVRSDGSLAWLRTYRLSREQGERARLLETLAAHEWHPERAAEALSLSTRGLIERLELRHLGWLLAPHLRRPNG